jgi:mycofactocin precursor
MSTAPEQLEQTAIEREPEAETVTPQPPDEALMVEDLVVEDVSIDGMCGVY